MVEERRLYKLASSLERISPAGDKGIICPCYSTLHTNVCLVHQESSCPLSMDSPPPGLERDVRPHPTASTPDDLASTKSSTLRPDSLSVMSEKLPASVERVLAVSSKAQAKGGRMTQSRHFRRRVKAISEPLAVLWTQCPFRHFLYLLHYLCSHSGPCPGRNTLPQRLALQLSVSLFSQISALLSVMNIHALFRALRLGLASRPRGTTAVAFLALGAPADRACSGS